MIARLSLPWSGRWRPVAVAISMLALSILVGVVIARLQLSSSPLLIALPCAALAVACISIVIHKQDNGAGIAAISESTLAALAFLLLPLNAVRLSANATGGDLFLLALLVPFVARLVTGRALKAPPWLILAVALISASIVVQVLVGLNLGVDVGPGVPFLVALAGTPLLLAGPASRANYREVLVGSWLLGSALTAVAALLDASGLTSIGLTLTGSAWEGRWPGLTVHPNHLGLVAVMAFPVAVWWLDRKREQQKQVAGAALVVLLVLGVFASGSRAALIALLVVGVLSTFTKMRNRKEGAISPVVLLGWGGLVVGAMVLMMATPVGRVVARLLGESGQMAADNDRLDAMMASLTSFYGSPLIGAGFSTIKVANNLVLQALQSGGLLTALGVVVYIFGAITRGLRASRVSDGLGTALALSLLAWLVDGMFQNIIYDRFLFLPVALVLALPSAHLGGNERMPSTAISNAAAHRSGV